MNKWAFRPAVNHGSTNLSHGGGRQLTHTSATTRPYTRHTTLILDALLEYSNEPPLEDKTRRRNVCVHCAVRLDTGRLLGGPRKGSLRNTSTLLIVAFSLAIRISTDCTGFNNTATVLCLLRDSRDSKVKGSPPTGCDSHGTGDNGVAKSRVKL
jgi:hypothetical protein